MRSDNERRFIQGLTAQEAIDWNKAINDARREAEEQNKKIIEENLFGGEVSMSHDTTSNYHALKAYSHVEEETERNLDNLQARTVTIPQQIQDIKSTTYQNQRDHGFFRTCAVYVKKLIRGHQASQLPSSSVLKFDPIGGTLSYQDQVIIRKVDSDSHSYYLYLHDPVHAANLFIVNYFLSYAAPHFYECVSVNRVHGKGVVQLYEPKGTGIIVADLPVILGYRVRENPDSPNVTLTNSAFRIPASQTPHPR